MNRVAKIIISILLVYAVFLPGVSFAKTSAEEEIVYKVILDRYSVGGKGEGQVNIDDPYTFHGGNLRGLDSKLGIIESLGYSAISLSPIMKNKEDGYHGYWIEDFFEIDKNFGSMEDFKKLTDNASRRNIKVILELVTNYLADSHPLLEESDREDWFTSVDSSLENLPSYLEEVVALDQGNPEVQDYLLSVVDYWMDETDISGFNLHAVDQMDPEFLSELIDHVRKKDESFQLYASILDPDKSSEMIEQFGDDLLIANHHLFEALTDTFKEVGRPVSDVFTAWEESGAKASYMFVDDDLGKRFSQLVVEQGRNPTTAWQLALTYMYTSPGAPVIFQGSEALMAGEGILENHRMVPILSGERELEQFFYRIASLKKEFPALSKGSFELVDSDGAMSVFKRSYEDESIFIAINNDDRVRKIDARGIEEGKRLKGVIGDNIARMNDDGSYSLGIPRESVEIYLIEEDLGINWVFIAFVAGVFILFVLAVIYLSIKQKRREAQA